MDKINELIGLIKSVEIKHLIDVLIAILVLVFFLICSSFFSYVIVKIFNMKENKKEILKKNPFYYPLKALFIVSGIYLASLILQMPQDIKDFLIHAYKISLICIVGKAIINLFAPDQKILSKMKENDKFATNDAAIGLISRIIKIIIYIILIFIIAKEFNFDIGGLVTGLGLSGVVIALAAQDIAKNLFAGFSIFTDKPFLVGDWIEVGDIAGTVEDITYRSTKIRTFQDSIVSIQNSTITSSNIINWSKMNKRVFQTQLYLPLETDEIELEKIINRIKFVLRYNKDLNKETMRVHLTQIEKEGYKISILVETPIIDYKKYLDFCNKLNLTILNILESEGIKPAYPGQNVYIYDGKEILDKNQKKKSVIEKKTIKKIKEKNK